MTNKGGKGKTAQDKAVSKTISFHPEALKYIDKLATEENKSRSQIVERAIVIAYGLKLL